MTNNVAKIRAALELANRGGKLYAMNGLRQKSSEALAALAELAELEKAAAEPSRWECEYANGNDETMVDILPFAPEDPSFYDKITPLYTTPPPVPVDEMREVVVTDEMAQRVANSFYGMDTFANKSEMRDALRLWRKELGPALGLVELKEPTPEECRDIWREAKANEGDGSKVCAGRAMFDACRAVLWPKEGL